MVEKSDEQMTKLSQAFIQDLLWEQTYDNKPKATAGAANFVAQAEYLITIDRCDEKRMMKSDNNNITNEIDSMEVDE